MICMMRMWLAFALVVAGTEGCAPKIQPSSPPPVPTSPQLPHEPVQPQVMEEKRAQNIILLIGDGMGLTGFGSRRNGILNWREDFQWSDRY
jgi:hypothetical protein